MGWDPSEMHFLHFDKILGSERVNKIGFSLTEERFVALQFAKVKIGMRCTEELMNKVLQHQAFKVHSVLLECSSVNSVFSYS